MVYNPFSPITRIIASKIAPVIKPVTQKFTQAPVIKQPSTQVGRPRVARPLYEVTAPPRFTGLAFGDVDTSSFPKAGGGTLPSSKQTKDRMAAAMKAAYTKPGFYSTYNFQTKKYELRPIPGKESEMKAIDKVLSRFNFGTSQYQFKGGAGLSPPMRNSFITDRLLGGITSRVALSPKKSDRGKKIATAAGVVGGIGLIDEQTGFLRKGLSGLDPAFVEQPASLNPAITTPPAGTTATVGSTGGGSRLYEVTAPQSPDSFYPGEGGLNDAVAKGAAKPGSANPTNPSFGGRRRRQYGGEFVVRRKTGPTVPVINPTAYRSSRPRMTKLPNRNNQFKINWL